MKNPTPLVAYAAMLAAYVLAGTSLLAFGVFLFYGSVRFTTLSSTVTGALAIDAALCIAFFVQHSGMVRTSFQNKLAKLVPRLLHPAIYATASGLVLFALLLLWQPTDLVLWNVAAPYRWLLRALFALAALVFVWAVRALGSFDGFGVRPIRAYLAGKPLRELPFTIRGPYRWVRHPLYSLILVLMWTYPEPTADRFLFNVLWTLWIFVGAMLEERDLVLTFGADYLRYQRRVPMLIPWRAPRSADVRA